jgi:cell wall-associated NlpC family hydrolase
VFATLGLVLTIGVATAAISGPHPASADQISDAKAEAAAITAKIQATEGQIAALSGQVQSADYQLSQLSSQIAANQAQVAKDQSEVTKDENQLRAQAISDYTSSGTTNQVTQMFSSSPNTSDIRSEYSDIATGDVTTTVDNLHTAQSQLQTAQAALQQQQSQATATRNNLQASESQASALAGQDQATLNSVNANIQNLVAQQQAQAAAAAKAAATASFNAKLAAAQRAQSAAATTTHSGGISSGGPASADPAAPAGPPPPLAGGAAGAVQAAESQVGVPYVWGGDTPAGFDCSGLVMWAYAQVGIGLPRTSGAQYGATTHIPLADIQPGDLLFYGPGGSEHVAMYVGGGSMVEAPYTGASVWITGVRTDGGFVGVGRVG